MESNTRMSHDMVVRLLTKYGEDADILRLLDEVSRKNRLLDIANSKVISYKTQLQGLHKYVAGKKMLETIE